jgi:hypothetical protein
MAQGGARAEPCETAGERLEAIVMHCLFTTALKMNGG